MNRKVIISLAALLIVGAGAFYAVRSGYFQIGKQAQVSSSANIEQAQEIEALSEAVEQLSEAVQASMSSSSSASSVPPASSMAESPTSMPESTPPVAVPMSQTSSSVPLAAPAPANKENAGTVFEGYTVTVTDKSTLAVRAGGLDWPITKYYFISAGGDFLGSISGKAMNAMIEKHQTAAGDAPNAGGEWEYWFAEEFNSYRGLTDGNSDAVVSEQDTPSSHMPKDNPNPDFDANELALEAFALVNGERANHGLGEVEMDATMMNRAEMRAEELEEKYDHVRPDGSRMSTTYKCAEIINRRANTAEIAVSSWMDSSGHKDIILNEKYSYAGIGCYQGSDGTVYWCMLFSK